MLGSNIYNKAVVLVKVVNVDYSFAVPKNRRHNLLVDLVALNFFVF